MHKGMQHSVICLEHGESQCSPQISLFVGESGSHLIYGSLGPNESTSQILIGSVIFAHLTVVPKRHTQTKLCAMSSNRPHLCSLIINNMHKSKENLKSEAFYFHSKILLGTTQHLVYCTNILNQNRALTLYHNLI